MRLTGYQKIQDGQLVHNVLDYKMLAKEYGTPLYIFDEGSFIDRVKAYQAAFQSDRFETEILYASKALLTKAIGKLIAQLGLGQDVVSGGEFYVGLTSGVPTDKMYFHGNNKTYDELQYAMSHGIGTVVLDNRMEAKRVNQIAQDLGIKQKVLIRLNPGVEAHTHDYIKTAHLDSKFGESIYDPEVFSILSEIKDLSHLDFRGIHSHIGSQIFQSNSFLQAADELLEFSKEIENKTSIKIAEINFGGGFGVYYTQEDSPFDVQSFLPEFIQFVEEKSQAYGLNLQKICIEPGRSLVNESGSTLYQVGDMKKTVGGKHYLFIDGSMNDNIRPALYQAKYEAILTNKADQVASQTYTVAGKACESGDKIIEDIDLPQAETGDYLLVNGTGAYNYTMASHYNRLSKPAMIHIKDKHHRLTVKRESYQDLCRNELED